VYIYPSPFFVGTLPILFIVVGAHTESIVALLSANGGWLHSGSGQGVRASFEDEFDTVYVLDLRGNSRRSYGNKTVASEGGNVFEVRIPVTMLILIKGGTNEDAPRGIFYHDIGDYLS
jgi:predicted helicase